MSCCDEMSLGGNPCWVPSLVRTLEESRVEISQVQGEHDWLIRIPTGIGFIMNEPYVVESVPHAWCSNKGLHCIHLSI